MPAVLISQLLESWPPTRWRDATVLVAVSGGADSVALLRALSEIRLGGRGRLAAAHFNHALRGPESDDDETFVRELCGQAEVELYLGRPPAGAELSAADGLEAAARQLRYEFLQATAERYGARYVVTAHTANDQVETILHRILRGTGLQGLAGIPRVRRMTDEISLLRPLLGLSRAAVLEYLRETGQAYREDSSNVDLSLTRNRIRRALIPLLIDDYNPQVEDALLRLGTIAAQWQQVADQRTSELYHACVRETAVQVTVDLQCLASVPAVQVREVLAKVWRDRRWPQQGMTFEKWVELSDPASSSANARSLPGGVTARWSKQLLILRGP